MATRRRPGAETEAYYRRHNVKQRRARLPFTDRTVPNNLGVAANLDLPAIRINATLAAVTAQRKVAAGQVTLYVNGAPRATIGVGSRTAVGNLVAGDLVHLRIVNGFVGVDEIRFFGNHDQEINRTKINANG